MPDVYKSCPTFENDRFLLRFSQLDDAKDLVSVYSDKNALPFFNSDNCHGDNFYYTNEERMRQAIEFWLNSYSSKWFVRWAIIDKETLKTIGTIELFHRSANDDFNHVGVLRLDLKSEHETSEEIFTVMNLIVPPAFDLFECEEIITKVPVYAVERIKAMKRVGFEKSAKLLIGTIDGYAYKDYGIIERKDILKTVTKDIDYDIANDFLRVYNLIRTQMEKEDILIISPEELERLGEAITQLKFEIMVKSAIKIARQMDIYIFSNIVNTFPVDFYSRLRYNCIGSMSTPSRSTRPRVRKDSSKRERTC